MSEVIVYATGPMGAVAVVREDEAKASSNEISITGGGVYVNTQGVELSAGANNWELR